MDEEHTLGKFQTKAWAVKFILDLVGFSDSESIEGSRVLDAGCGKGTFLLEALERSLSRANLQNVDPKSWVKEISERFIGYEIDGDLCTEAREKVRTFLITRARIESRVASSASQRMIIQGDFLKWKSEDHYDFIVGNPPYVRYDSLSHKYVRWLKKEYSCFRGRADLCVPFIEHSLELLSNTGKLAFICSDRFTLCDYGKRLRSLISTGYGVKRIIDLTSTKPFDSTVSAYPLVLVIDREGRRDVLFSRLQEENSSSLVASLGWRKIDSRFFTGNAWRVPDAHMMMTWDTLVRTNHKTLGEPEYGVGVGAGIATGADDVFINPPKEAQIERELLIPFALPHNLKRSRVVDATELLLNTWDPADHKRPIILTHFPNAYRYLKKNKARLASRHVAKKNPSKWYRLIDHFDRNLLSKEKLIFPSLRNHLDVYFDRGVCVPHHNCYYATKRTEGGPSLLAIGAILSSSIVNELASALTIKFNGSASRLLKESFLQIPMPELKLLVNRQEELETGFLRNDVNSINKISRELYGNI